MPEENKKYYLTDIESGQRYEVTKEQHERYLKMLDDLMPKVKPEFPAGKIIFFGTGGNLESGCEQFEKMWKLW